MSIGFIKFKLFIKYIKKFDYKRVVLCNRLSSGNANNLEIKIEFFKKCYKYLIKNITQ